MFEIGRICMKVAGRDAGKYCIIINTVDERHVLIEGYTRRRKCNIAHLESLSTVAKIAQDAAEDVVIKALEDAGYKRKMPKKGAARQAKERPKKSKAKKLVEEKAVAKKTSKDTKAKKVEKADVKKEAPKQSK